MAMFCIWLSTRNKPVLTHKDALLEGMGPCFHIVALINAGLLDCTEVGIRAYGLGHDVWPRKFKIQIIFGMDERSVKAFILPQQAMNGWHLPLPVQSQLCMTASNRYNTWRTCTECMLQRATCQYLCFDVHSTVKTFVTLRQVYQLRKPFCQHCQSVLASNCTVVHPISRVKQTGARSTSTKTQIFLTTPRLVDRNMKGNVSKSKLPRTMHKKNQVSTGSFVIRILHTWLKSDSAVICIFSKICSCAWSMSPARNLQARALPWKVASLTSAGSSRIKKTIQMVLRMEYNLHESHSCKTRSVGHIAIATRHCLFFLTK